MGMVITNKLDFVRVESHRSSPNKATLLLTALLFVLQILYAYNHEAYAQGVAAGTDITNITVVNYKIKGKQQTPLESSPTGNSVAGIGKGQPTLFKVDRKIDLLVTANTHANVAPGDKQAEVTYTLINEGNDNQEFSFLLDPALLSDDFNITNCLIVVSSLSGTPLNGVSIPTTGNIRLKADQQANISVRCDIPQNVAGQPLIKGNTALLSLYAIADKNDDGSKVQENTTTDTALGIETVFADDAGTDDGNRDATHTARTTYTIGNEAPTLSIDKTLVHIVTPNSPSSSEGNNQSNDRAIKGSIVTYKISITTTGTGIINNTIITDPTPTGMTYKTGSLVLNNRQLTDDSDADRGDFGITNNNTATINLGNITAGNLNEIQLSYIIN